VSVCVYLWLIVFFAFTQIGHSQVRPVYDRGATGLLQILKRLNTSASVLMIGAHPDDEDTALLAYLARGESARTAYLSLTRGDGGQNIIGTELGEALGVIRTEELLQARRLDGAEQYFTRAYDYGFSKTLAEARQKWDEKIILCDAVRVIRNFRPLVVVSQFSGTPADGHGQHQFAGYISPLAVKAAADPAQCTDAGPVWTVKKFYVRHRGTGEPTLRINTGKYDPLLGRSYFEIAMEARSQHKSQEQGVLELRGEQFSNLNLVESHVPKREKETSIFEGIDTTIASIHKTFNSTPRGRTLVENLASIDDSIKRAQRELSFADTSQILTTLIQGYRKLNDALEYDPPTLVSPSGEETWVADWATDSELRRKTWLLAEAIKSVVGLQIDALADRETVAPGEAINVSVKTFLGNKQAVKVLDAKLLGNAWWSVTTAGTPQAPTQGFFRREAGDHEAYFTATLSADAQPTRPYWLIDPRQGDMFRWRGSNQTMPFQITLPRAEVTVEINGTELKYQVPVEFRFADDIRGEIRRDVNIVPQISMDADQKLIIVSASDKPQTRRVMLSITNLSANSFEGSSCLCAGLNGGWTSLPLRKNFVLKSRGEKALIPFEFTIPAKQRPVVYELLPAISYEDGVLSYEMNTLAYTHIKTHRFYKQLKIKVVVTDLQTTPVKIGYIQGSGDRVQDAIKQMGFNVETITESELASGDLSKYDTIVVGIRAFQVRPDVVANNTRLLDYARNGGTLVVQYQLPPYGQTHAPFAVQQGPRVADENAAVTLLDEKHPIFNLPNKITADDFTGWVQERNLYNFTNIPAEYTGLLESHDAGEAENKGGLVIAKLGKGNYVYCSYSMFRQLPAGVPGAYRLFANLLSLPKASKK
jgi:LmbE family N-acetylglucosaminyl deacetylase